MRRVLIAGAGGFGREVLNWLGDLPDRDREWSIQGFLDDNLSAGQGFPRVHVVGSIQGYTPDPHDLLVMALGQPRAKLQVGEELLARGAEFMCVVHPTAVIGHNVTLGRGCVICPHAVVTCDIVLGDFVMMNVHSTIGHDAVVGPGSTVGPYAAVSGYARLGRGALLGGHAMVLPNARIGEFATVGAGSVVVKYAKPGATVFGVPAKTL